MIPHLTSGPKRFDDIENGSELRRGRPAAHPVFGIAQTVNAATCAIINVVTKYPEQ